MSQQPKDPDFDTESVQQQRLKISGAGGDRVQIEFQIDDLVRRLIPGIQSIGHCGGCDACSGCKH
jgi:hypothetical protein